MTDPLFEPKLRWRGAPPTCSKTGLLAFTSEESAIEYHDKTNRRAQIEKPFRCVVCGLWHYNTKPRK